MSMPDHPLPVAVTIGEPAGVGVDAFLKQLEHASSGSAPPLPPCVLLCDPDQILKRAKLLNIKLWVEEYSGNPEDLDVEKMRTVNVLPLRNQLRGLPGQPDPSDAKGIIEAITTAVEWTIKGKFAGITTLPINKKSLYDAGFEYPGHTEFLGALSDKRLPDQAPYRPVMMLAGPKLKAVPVTIHIPLKDVPEALTTDSIVDTAFITAQDLKSRFGIENPRLAISGLNPHAGENGALGSEDRSIIVPAIEALKARGIDCVGPLPADTMFHEAARTQYDVAICMYHDQALIPAKALGFDDTVNVTLGLPFIRTSPDHGTAFDIAGTDKVNPASTVAAIRLASDMALAHNR